MEYTIADIGLLYPQVSDNYQYTGILPMVLYKLFGRKPVELSMIKTSSLVNAMNENRDKKCIIVAKMSYEQAEIRSDILSTFGYLHNSVLETFFKNKYGLTALCMTNIKEYKTIIIHMFGDMFLERLGYDLYTLLPAMIPWEYENNQTHVTPEQAEAIKEIVEDIKEYEQTGFIATNTSIYKLLNDENLRKEIDKTRIDKFAEAMLKQLIDSKEEDVKRYKEMIEEEIQRIKRMRIEYKLAKDKMIAIKYGGEGEMHAVNEMLDFITNSKQITMENIDQENCEITIRVNGYLSSWNEETIETLIKNKRSYMYWPELLQEHQKEAQKFWTELFVNETIRLPMQALYQIYVKEQEVNVYQNGIFDKDEYRYTCPNPHLFFYKCLGTVEESFENAFAEGDLVKIPMLCTVSVGSLHTEEEPVMEAFVRKLFEGNYEIEYNGERFNARNFMLDIFSYFPDK